jgi:hypothetical protein
MTEIIDAAAMELPNGKIFAGAEALETALRDLDPERYADVSVTQLMARSVAPDLESTQVRIGKDRYRGYYAQEIKDLWEEIAPAELKDAQDPEEDNPLAVTDDDDEVFEVAVTTARNRRDKVLAGQNERVTASQGSGGNA